MYIDVVYIYIYNIVIINLGYKSKVTVFLFEVIIGSVFYQIGINWKNFYFDLLVFSICYLVTRTFFIPIHLLQFARTVVSKCIFYCVWYGVFQIHVVNDIMCSSSNMISTCTTNPMSYNDGNNLFCACFFIIFYSLHWSFSTNLKCLILQRIHKMMHLLSIQLNLKMCSCELWWEHFQNITLCRPTSSNTSWSISLITLSCVCITGKNIINNKLRYLHDSSKFFVWK